MRSFSNWKICATVAVLSIAFAFSSLASQAQNVILMNGSVPFAFTMAKAQFQPGQYTFRIVDHKFLYIIGPASTKVSVIHEVRDSVPSEANALVFLNRGGQYSLSSIQMSGGAGHFDSPLAEPDKRTAMIASATPPTVTTIAISAVK